MNRVIALSSSLIFLLLLSPAWATPPRTKARAKAEGDRCREVYEWLRAQPDLAAFRPELLPARIPGPGSEAELKQLVASMRETWSQSFRPDDLIEQLRKIESGDFSPVHGAIGSDRLTAEQMINPSQRDASLRELEDGLLSVSSEHRLHSSIDALRSRWDALSDRLSQNDFMETIARAKELRQYLQSDEFKEGLANVRAASPTALTGRVAADASEILDILGKSSPTRAELERLRQYIAERAVFHSARQRVAPSVEESQIAEYLRRFDYELDRHLPTDETVLPLWIRDRLKDLVARYRGPSR